MAIIQLGDRDAVGGGHGEQGFEGGAMEIVITPNIQETIERGDQRVSSAHTNDSMAEFGGIHALPCLLHRISVPFNLVL